MGVAIGILVVLFAASLIAIVMTEKDEREENEDKDES
jgi:hypothetical protein